MGFKKSEVHLDIEQPENIERGFRMVVIKRRARQRRVYLRIDTFTGAVHVSAPLGVSQAEILKIVKEQEPWIEQQIPPMSWEIQKGHTYYQGKKWNLHWHPHSHSGFRIGEQDLYLYGPGYSQLGVDEKSTKLMRFYLQQLVEQSRPLLEDYKKKFGFPVQKIQFKYLKSSWGLCYPERQEVILNTLLARYKPECLEYVIAHEFCHLNYADHGPEFKKLLDQVYPNWRVMRAQLRKPPFES